MFCVLGGLAARTGAQNFVVINEIHYNPAVKTDLIEFIELFNNGTNNVDLGGWQFTAGVSYTFPAGLLMAPGTFRVIAQNPAALAVKFPGVTALGPYTGSLSKYGEKITLVNAGGGLEDEVAYTVGFPWPTVGDLPDASIELTNPGFDNNLGGSWRASKVKPTPGVKNSTFTNNIPPQIRQVEHHPEQPVAGEVVTISAKVTDPDGVASVTLQYQLVDPGSYIESTDVAYTNNWTALAMNDTGTGGDEVAADDVYTAQLPGSFQVNRRLVRYRIIVTDTGGRSVRVPYADDAQLNFAYFVYDGVPAHRAALRPGTTTAVDFTTNVMRRLQVAQLIARSNTVAKCMWFDRYRADLIYPYAGTLVYDGKVFDNIHFRARGGVWRYSMVKNMWKIDLNRGHYLEPRDDYGQKFKVPWAKVNMGACIQQGDFNHPRRTGPVRVCRFQTFSAGGRQRAEDLLPALARDRRRAGRAGGQPVRGRFLGVVPGD